MTLPEENWIAMRKGQRYSVVVTQKCNTDGKWYQGAGLAKGKPTEMVLKQYRQQAETSVKIAHLLVAYKTYYEEYKKQGMEEEAAIANAKSASVGTIAPRQSNLAKTGDSTRNLANALIITAACSLLVAIVSRKKLYNAF